MKKELAAARKRIDHTDSKIISALTERAAAVRIIGTLKSQANLQARDKKREARMLAARTRVGRKKGLSPTFVKKLFKLIHDESVRIQKSV